ncbi:hypothetical protein [Sphingomonas humi]|uniref:Uncharacterized protein n=1 Tax=Sphingomonas humi TaxID=335630 RepID=A0ABP7RPV6_9SPHN
MIFTLVLSAALLAPNAGSLTIDGVGAPTADGLIPLSVSAGDVDGDGVADRGTLLLRCEGGLITEAWFDGGTSPRDAASGMASGRSRDFDKASPVLAKMRPHYVIKEMKGARVMGSRKGYEAYQALSLSNAAGLCPAATMQSSTVRATKTRSNIQNN